jgi:hypothetical protein
MYYRKHLMTGVGDPKTFTPKKEKKHFKSKRKPTGELELYNQIWRDRPHISQFSGEKLIEMNVCFFLHVLPKSNYPKFRLYKPNIWLGTFDEHYIQTNLPREKWIPSFRVQWEELETKLKSEYLRMYGKK